MNKALEQKMVERWPTWFKTEGNDSGKLLFLIENREDDEPVVHGKEPDDDDKKWMKSIGIEVGEPKRPFSGGTEKSY
jgi:hypothetical protein